MVEKKNAGSITVGGETVPPGARATVDLPVADLYTHTSLTMPVHIVNGKRPGPTLFLTAAIHGDELNGVEIIRRVLRLSSLKRLRGCVLAVPVVNVFGFLNRSRYLPDRRDLNRSFPGSEKGSIAARLANLLTREIVEKSDYGIDLHTGAIERTNLPQIRGDLSNPEVLRLAKEFGTPVIINANIRDGSLRQLAAEHGIPMLLYESGEALRFDELSVKAGVRGIGRVLRGLGMLPKRARKTPLIDPVRTNSTTWIRAPASGMMSVKGLLGERISSDAVLATIRDPFNDVSIDVKAPEQGLLIGRSTSPLVHEGDALFHLARFEDFREAAATVDEFQETHAVEATWG